MDAVGAGDPVPSGAGPAAVAHANCTFDTAITGDSAAAACEDGAAHPGAATASPVQLAGAADHPRADVGSTHGTRNCGSTATTTANPRTGGGAAAADACSAGADATYGTAAIGAAK